MLNQNNVGTQVFIDKWDGVAYSDALDVSPVFTGVDWGYSSWDESGLRRIKGNLSLGGYPLTPLSESLDPRSNPARFQRGNRVRVLYNAATVAVLYILTFPLPAHPGSPELEIQLGCVLELLSYRQPPDTESEAILARLDGDPAPDPAKDDYYGEELTALEVIRAYLAYSGVGEVATVTGSCTGSLFTQQKDSLGSWIEEAGKIAFANGHFIWQQSSGNVAISAIALSPASPAHQIQIGGWNGEEVEFEPTANSETPVERVICTGELVEFEDTLGTFTDVSTEYGSLATITQGAIYENGIPTERVVTGRTVVTETFTETQRTRTVLLYQAKMLVNPWFNDTSPVLAKITTETWHYDGDAAGGKLRDYEKLEKSPAVSIAPQWAGMGLKRTQENPVIPGSIFDMSLRPVFRERHDYIYDSEDAVSEVERIEAQIALGIEERAFYGRDEWQGVAWSDLITSGGISEQWIGDHDSGYWRRKYKEIGLMGGWMSSLQGAQDSPSYGYVAFQSGIIKSGIETSGTGATQPPTAERRQPLKTEKRSPIEGDCEFLLLSPSPFQERERFYPIPYGNTVEKLNARAEELGTLLIGRSLGVSFTLPIADFTAYSAIHERIDFTVPDGSIQAFLIDNLSFAIDSTTAVVSADGVYIGSVADAIAPSVIHPVYRQNTKAVMATGHGIRVEDSNDDYLDQLARLSTGHGIHVVADVAQGIGQLSTGHGIQAIGEPFEGNLQLSTGHGLQMVSAQITLVTGTKSPVGTAGMTQVISATDDDAALSLSLPFTAKFYGADTTQIYPCSNMFIALQSQVTDYQNHSLTTPIPAQRTIHVGSADNSWQRVYTYSDPDGRFYRLRVEGTAGTSGTPGSPDIVYEATFYPPTGNVQYVELVFGAHNRPSGVFGISNGLSGGSNINTNGGTITPNESYVFQSDANGDNWTITAGRYITIN